MKTLIGLLIVLFFSATVQVAATLGVGVGTGKIEVQDKLKPGQIYTLPSFSVVNTGDEAADYEVTLTYHEGQPQLKPEVSWMVLSPQNFHLEPGEIKVVNVKLNLPIKAKPGEYFAYLEGHPVKKSNGGGASIGIAAASKLYFTVQPANVVLGAYYKASSLWQMYSPWPKVVVSFVATFIGLRLLSRFFKIEFKRKSDVNNTDNENG